MDEKRSPSNPRDLRAELDAALNDAVRRAANRAEHIRLTRIQSLVLAINGPNGSSGVSGGTAA